MTLIKHMLITGILSVCIITANAQMRSNTITGNNSRSIIAGTVYNGFVTGVPGNWRTNKSFTWYSVGTVTVPAKTNTSAAGTKAVACDASNCSGEDKKCINGECVTGQAACVGSEPWGIDPDGNIIYFKTYKYYFPENDSYSEYEWHEYSDVPCDVSAAAKLKTTSGKGMACDAGNCSGVDKKCINGECVTGQAACVGSEPWGLDPDGNILYYKTYKYLFVEDMSYSEYEWYEYSNVPCDINSTANLKTNSKKQISLALKTSSAKK